MLSLALALPGTIMAMIGMSSDEFDMLAGTLDEGMGALETALEDGLLDAASELAGDLFWMQNSKRHHKAAESLQKSWRGAKAREKAEGMEGETGDVMRKLIQRSRKRSEDERARKSETHAARMMQRTYRAWKARAVMEASENPEHVAFMKKMRGKIAQRQIQARRDKAEKMKEREAILWRKKISLFEVETKDFKETGATARPGFGWLESLIEEDEKIERAEDAQEASLRMRAQSAKTRDATPKDTKAQGAHPKEAPQRQELSQRREQRPENRPQLQDLLQRAMAHRASPSADQLSSAMNERTNRRIGTALAELPTDLPPGYSSTCPPAASFTSSTLGHLQLAGPPVQTRNYEDRLSRARQASFRNLPPAGALPPGNPPAGISSQGIRHHEDPNVGATEASNNDASAKRASKPRRTFQSKSVTDCRHLST